MAITQDKCLLCHNANGKQLLSVDTRQLIRCPGCGFVWLDPMPSITEIASFYTNGEVEIPNSANHFTYKKHLDLIEAFSKKGKLLDVGAWYGEFLLVARKQGWDVTGVELNQNACDAVYQNYGIEMIPGDISDAISHYGKDSFDVVTLFHVLEHLPDPAVYLIQIQQLLKTNGQLVIRTPNIHAALFKLLGKYWGHLALPVHLYFYSPETIALLLKQCHFKVSYLSTPSSPATNEVFELFKGVLKIIGIKKIISSGNIRSDKGLKQNQALDQTGFMPRTKGWLNRLTTPLFLMTYPLWKYLELSYRGSELFVIATKEK